MTDFADSDDYEDYTQGAAPANVAALLRSASNMVRAAIRTAIYDVDSDGAATDDDVIAALRDATCAQAAAWSALGIDPLTGGVLTNGKIVTSKSLDGASLTYAGAASAADARAAATTSLVPDAVQILRDAGLLSDRVWTYG